MKKNIFISFILLVAMVPLKGMLPQEPATTNQKAEALEQQRVERKRQAKVLFDRQQAEERRIRSERRVEAAKERRKEMAENAERRRTTREEERLKRNQNL